MSRRSTRQNAAWSRCSEGFSDMILPDADVTANQIKENNSSKSNKNDFSHGNIFEKLAFNTEETSQSITWSSSDDDQPSLAKKVEPEIPQSVPHSVPKPRPTTSSGRKRRKTSSPRAKIVRKRLTNHQAAEVVDIRSDSDTETVNNSTKTASGQSSEAAIKSYDSGTEEGSTQQTETSQVTDTQDTPSIADSVSSSSPITQTGTGVKASDWVKSLQLKTPSKSHNQSRPPEVEDSTKKKKKFCRGGLADRLSRLVARDKSTVRMFSHQLNKPSLSQDSKALSLVVCGYETLYSLQVVRCRLVPPLPAATGDQAQPDPEAQGQGGLEKLVMFPATQADQLSLQLGTKFKIFPPWQQLELRNGREIYLCTKYCQVISHPDDTGLSETGAITPVDEKLANRTEEDEHPVKAAWNCPCVQGLCKNQTLCPAYQFPCVPGWIKIPPSTSAACTSGMDDNSNELKKSETDKLKDGTARHKDGIASHLHTVSRSPGSLPEEPVFDSLLESIERGRTAISEEEESNSKVFCFKGHVHRAVWYREPLGSKSCRLLVEDCVGVMCEIRLQAETLMALNPDPGHLEGQSYLFSGLKVADRLVREKNPCLFTLVDSVWSGKSYGGVSQDLDLTQGEPQEWTSEPPGYCYVLSSRGQTGHDPKLDPCLETERAGREPVYRKLADLKDLDPQPARCSCIVRPLFVYSMLKEPAADCVLYVTDSSLKKPQQYVKVRVQSVCDFLKDAFTHNSSHKPVVQLRDMYVEKGEAYADEYTRIIAMTTGESHTSSQLQELSGSLDKLPTALPELGHSMQSGDLCTLSGCIYEVDEDSAYSWEICTKCGSEQLEEQENDSLMKCLACGHAMVEPKTMMKMEVLVLCNGSGCRVKVDLLQSTIETLLPREEADEEGYELTSVLRKTVGPLTCIVHMVDQTSNKQQKLTLREIELL